MNKKLSIDPIEEALYERVASEISDGQIRQGLWLKATVESNGDNFKARAIYTRYRVEQLATGLAEELAAKSAAKSQTDARLARERQAEIERQRKAERARQRELHFKRVEYSPQEQAKLERQNRIAGVILVSVFIFLLVWALLHNA